MSTNVTQLFSDLDGGVFLEKLAHTLSEVAGAVTDHEKKGEVNINLKMSKIQNSDQVQIEHTVKFKKPTMRGSIIQDDATSTPMYVGTKGALSFHPIKQPPLFDQDSSGKVASIKSSG
ncbi:hypothetical protein MO867_20150 [Microbulbifer sp. OS29]|uniref:Uncharacterized protein n=1 Tax=Microbulbifer okhotskensis TaxID=2926617 RepID=A0A9X2ERU6_9GAMM|nr:hypothetical protein [Microbulbifer okhotskensis]MCO1336641.1 hypothetical protein [Microbulbifer okhotskensis]